MSASSLGMADDYGPTFSVIVPTYGRRELLSRAIASVLAQTYDDFELVVVDDASPTDAQGVIASFHDDRIRYIRREKNGGLAATRNTGIRQARGIYISFLDDDDEYLPHFLEETYRRFQSAPAELGFVGCGVQEIDTTEGHSRIMNRIPVAPNYRDREHAYLSFLKHIPFTGWFLTIRPICFEVVGLFDEQVRTEQDRDLLYRLVRNFDYDVIPLVLARHYHHSAPHLNVYGPKKASAYEHILQKNLKALRRQPRLWAEWHYKTGWLHYHSGSKTRGRLFMLQALRRRPWYAKAWLGLLLFETFGPRAPGLHQKLNQTVKRLRPPRRPISELVPEVKASGVETKQQDGIAYREKTR